MVAILWPRVCLVVKWHLGRSTSREQRWAASPRSSTIDRLGSVSLLICSTGKTSIFKLAVLRLDTFFLSEHHLLATTLPNRISSSMKLLPASIPLAVAFITPILAQGVPIELSIISCDPTPDIIYQDYDVNCHDAGQGLLDCTDPHWG